MGLITEWSRKYPSILAAEAVAKRLVRKHQKPIEIRMDDDETSFKRTLVATVLLDATGRLWVQVESDACHLL